MKNEDVLKYDSLRARTNCGVLDYINFETGITRNWCERYYLCEVHQISSESETKISTNKIINLKTLHYEYKNF
jgi:hypothetical protein